MTAIGATRTMLFERPARAVRRWRRSQATSEVTSTGRVVAWASGIVIGLAAWLVLFGLVLSGLEEQHAQHNLYTAFRTQLAAATAPIGGAVADGKPVALIESSAADLRGLVVVEGTTSSDLRLGPGHYPGTPLPGQPGASLLLGRGTSFGAPFAGIAALKVGDVITTTTGQGKFHYVVTGRRRNGDPAPALLAAGAGQLTLVTSTNGGWSSAWTDNQTLFVDAALRDKPVAAPTRTAAPSSADKIQHSDTSGLFSLVLWMQLLLVGTIAFVWAQLRWGRPQSWLIGVPILLGATWGATNSLWLLLPNIF